MSLAFSNLDVPVLTAAGLKALQSKDSILNNITHNYLGADTTARTAVRVPYMNKGTGSIWASSTGYGSQNNTVNGIDVIFTEPIFVTDEITPNQNNSYNIEYLATTLVPNQAEAVFAACRQRVEQYIDATTFPVQISGSTGTLDMVKSGSGTIFTSGSNAQQFVVTGQKFDQQLQSNLITLNYLAGAQIIAGNYANGYTAGYAQVTPAYDMPTNATGADAAVLIGDSILGAARIPQVHNVLSQVSVVDPRSNFPLLFFTWVNPVNQTLNFTTAVQFNTNRGRVGFGARLKVN